MSTSESHRKPTASERASIGYERVIDGGTKVKYHQVADQVRAHIHTGRYKPGDKLPTEHELARLTGVHRVTVRNAYDLLAAEGRIETRPGDGSYVIRRRKNPPLP